MGFMTCGDTTKRYTRTFFACGCFLPFCLRQLAFRFKSSMIFQQELETTCGQTRRPTRSNSRKRLPSGTLPSAVVISRGLLDETTVHLPLSRLLLAARDGLGFRLSSTATTYSILGRLVGLRSFCRHVISQSQGSRHFRSGNPKGE